MTLKPQTLNLERREGATAEDAEMLAEFARLQADCGPRVLGGFWVWDLGFRVLGFSAPRVQGPKS